MKSSGFDVTKVGFVELGGAYVAFDANGGESVPDAYREYNQEIGVLPVTEQTGYNFIGWYTERDGGTKVHPSDVITAPVTY